MLGLYISGHPLFEYENSLSRLTPIEALDSLEDKTSIVIGGIISRIKIIYTKKEQQMCFMDLEDITNSIEVIVFPSIFEKFKGIIFEDKIVSIKGKLDKKEDQLKVIANEFDELKKDKRVNKSQKKLIGEKSSRIVFTIKKCDMNKNFINQFYDVLKKYPGFSDVEFKITDKNGKDIEKIYKLPSSYRIELSQTLEENLKELFADKISWDVV